MPAPYGVTETGFNAPTLEEILTRIEESQRANISTTLDTSTQSPLGQVNGIIASAVREAWEGLQAAHDSNNPDAASGYSMAQLALLTGTKRLDADESSVLCNCTLAIGTYAIGELVAHVVGNPDARFANAVEVVVTVGGLQSGILFEAEETGPVQALAGTLTVIAEPVVGWTTVTNPLAADLGSDIESIVALRARREEELAGAGSATVAAIKADILAIDEAEVSSVTMFENDTDVTVGSLPPHSIEAVVDASVSVTDDEIAQAIYDSKAAGIQAVGTTSGTAVDENGDEHSIGLSRVAQVEIFVEIDAEMDYSVWDGSEPAMEAAIEDAAQAITWTNGEDIVPAKISAAVFPVYVDGVLVAGVAGVKDITEIRLGFTASPVGTTRLSIGSRERGTLAAAQPVVAVTEFAET